MEVIEPSLKILFFNVPLHGHVNPTLDLVAELVRRGSTVVYYAGETFREKIEAVNAKFVSYGDVFKFSVTRDNTNIFNTAKEMVDAAEIIIDTYLKQISEENFDLILYDVSAVWGKWFATILKKPSVCCFPGLAPQWRGYIRSKTIIMRGIKDGWEGYDAHTKTCEVRDRITRKYKIQKLSTSQMFAGSELLNIVFTSPYFQPFSEFMTQNYVFIGPTLQDRKETVKFPFDDISSDKKIIYISMGTLYRQDPAFFKTCFEAFKSSPNYQVIISVGKAVKIDDLEPIPNNFIVKNYVPQLEVLEKTHVFISHAGMNSISEAMFYNVPLLLLPKTIEQQINAKRMEELGTGIDLKGQVATPQKLRECVAMLLRNPRYVEQTKVVSESFKQTGGVIAAVDVLLKLKV